MILFNELKFGDVVYSVEAKNNAFNSKKIYMEQDGVTWYRYDKPTVEYEIIETVFCGKITYLEEGEVRFNEDRENEYHFKYPDGQIYTHYIDGQNSAMNGCDASEDFVFKTLKEADLAIEFMLKEHMS